MHNLRLGYYSLLAVLIVAFTTSGPAQVTNTTTIFPPQRTASLTNRYDWRVWGAPSTNRSAAFKAMVASTNRAPSYQWKPGSSGLVLPAPERLLKAGFVLVSPGIFKNKQLSFGDAKKLLGFRSSDMRFTSSTPTFPGSSDQGSMGYHVIFSKGYCALSLPPTGDMSDSVPVTVIVHTNDPPASAKTRWPL